MSNPNREIRYKRVIVALALYALAGMVSASVRAQSIDRHALVTRHNVVLRQFDVENPLTIGNGEFAFNCDVTGLQSFPEYYEKKMPIGILSTWGWHSFPNPNGYTLDNFKMKEIKKVKPATYAWVV